MGGAARNAGVLVGSQLLVGMAVCACVMQLLRRFDGGAGRLWVILGVCGVVGGLVGSLADASSFGGPSRGSAVAVRAGRAGGGVAPRSKLVVARRAPGCSSAVSRERVLAGVRTSVLGLPGRPWSAVSSRDGRWSFVSLAAARPSVEVFSDSQAGPVPVRVIGVSRTTLNGMALTHDGRLLLVAAGNGALVLDVRRAETGRGRALLGRLTSGKSQRLATQVVVSPDDRYVFLSTFQGGGVQVFDLHSARVRHFRSSGFVGSVPAGQALDGLVGAPSGRSLYAVDEASGTLGVIDERAAESTPTRAVVATVTAGCNPMLDTVSADGRTVWVTARTSNALIAYSARQLHRDPRKAIAAVVRVGEAPIGLAIVNHGKEIVVADSHHPRSPRPPTTAGDLAVVSTKAALGGRPAVLGILPAGVLPREVSASPGSSTLLVTNLISSQLETIDTASLP